MSTRAMPGGCSIGILSTHHDHAIGVQRRAGDLGEQIRATEDVRLLDIIDRGMAMVEAVAGRQDQHGAPIDYKAASALGTVLRASESRRRLYGVDAPTKVTASFAAPMTEEEALAILADYDNPFPG